MQSLKGLTTGRYVVTTQNGTRHVVDLDDRTVTRYGAPGRGWSADTDVGYGPVVAGDGEPFFFTRLDSAEVGQQMYAFYKGGYLDADFWRQTSTIVSIEEETPPEPAS